MYLKKFIDKKNIENMAKEVQTINFAHSKWPEMSGDEDEMQKS